MAATLTMTAPVDDAKLNWAQEVEAEGAEQDTDETVKECVEDGIRTVTEIKFETDQFTKKEQKVKVISKFQITTKRVPRAVAQRRLWPKFGECQGEKKGCNPANFYVADETKIQWVRNRAGELLFGDAEGEAITKLKEQGGSAVHCRLCKSKDHWSINCPYKDTLLASGDDMSALDQQGMPNMDGTGAGMAPGGMQGATDDKSKPGTYVPPSQRRGAVAGTGTTMDSRREENTIRLTNLPEDTIDDDIRELCSRCGKVSRIYLAKDKIRDTCKGFAFVTFEMRSDADKAVKLLNGHRYAYCIIKVEWAQ